MAGLARHEQGQQSLQENYLMQSRGAMAFSEELCPLVSLHCFAFWERQLHYYKQGSFKSASLSRLRRWRALKAPAASTHGTSPLASLIISTECRNEMYFSGDFFSRWTLFTYKEKRIGLQIGFSSGVSDGVCSCSACAVLSGEVGRVEGGCVHAQGWQSDTFDAVQHLKIKIDFYGQYVFLLP